MFLFLCVAAVPLATIFENIQNNFVALRKDNRVIRQDNRLLRAAVVAVLAPRATSTKSERLKHKEAFKNSVRARYGCVHPDNPNVTKCMVLNHFLSTNIVSCGHILSLEQKPSLSVLGLVENDIWNARNGILWYADIEKKYSSQELVRLLFLLL